MYQISGTHMCIQILKQNFNEPMNRSEIFEFTKQKYSQQYKKYIEQVNNKRLGLLHYSIVLYNQKLMKQMKN
jgi:hypothetical protein